MHKSTRWILALMMLSSITLAAIGYQTVGAGEATWTNSNLNFRYLVGDNDFATSGRGTFKQLCNNQKMMVVRNANNPVGDLLDTCFYDFGDWGIGRYSYKTYSYLPPSYGWGVRIGSSGALYNGPKLNVDMIMAPAHDGYLRMISKEMRIYKDVRSQLHENIDSKGLKTYTYDGNFEQTLTRPNGEVIEVRYDGTLSNNGKWMVADAVAGLVRVNLDTGEALRFEGIEPNYWDNPGRDFAISDDGNHIAVMGGQTVVSYNPGRHIYDIVDGCGDDITNTTEYHTPMVNECPKVDLTHAIATSPTHEGHSMQGQYPYFEDDGNVLIFQVRTRVGNGYASRWGRLIMSGTKDQRLDYLALGDSISSGEGDTIGKDRINNWYRWPTDVDGGGGQPREKCHLSTRSYPYLLAEYMNLYAGDWNSVACSGARSDDIKLGMSNYLGQREGGALGGNSPRLEGYDVMELQRAALGGFIPGRVEQIEFVKLYKPRVITVTVGANDIGFAGKLTDCAMWAAVCEWADRSVDSLAGQIQNEYDQLKKLYMDLAEASDGESKIYALGYPMMFYEGYNEECNDVLLLNGEERKMIVSATKYLNRVIEHAANAAGVTYVDIVDSLEGGRICDDGQKYVNGASFVGSANPLSVREGQESFHPNHLGHVMMANYVARSVDYEDLRTYTVCDDGSNICPKSGPGADKPPVPASLGGEAKNSFSAIVTWFQHIKGEISRYVVEATENHFAAHSDVKVTIHSDPVDLGTFTTDSDGGLSFDAVTPTGIEPGYHTLVMEGINDSGEYVELTQTIVIVGDNPSDLDENGILDSQQKCGLFLPDYICDEGIRVDTIAASVTSLSDWHGVSAEQHSEHLSYHNRWTVVAEPKMTIEDNLIEANDNSSLSIDSKGVAAVDYVDTKAVSGLQVIIISSAVVVPAVVVGVIRSYHKREGGKA